MKPVSLYTRWLAVLCLFIASTGSATVQEAIFSHSLTLWGTAKYPAGFAHFEYANPEAPRGGEVKIASTGTFDNLNPFIIKGTPAPGSASVFESLMVGALDEPQSYYGLVADGVLVAPDRSYADFRLRKDARFHDGSPITVDDIIFSLDIFKTKADPNYRILYAAVASAERISDTVVRFRFSDTSKRELPITVATMPILSKAYYAQHDFTQTTLQPPLASGAYKIVAVDQGRNLVYERVKDYWGDTLPVNRGQNNFDRIRYDMYRDETVALEAFKAGEFDFRQENVARAWATGYDSPAFREGRYKKEFISNEVPQGMQGFVFNLRKPKFTDRRVREAIALTLDFEWMNKSLFFDAYTRNKSFFQHTTFESKGLPSAAERELLTPFQEHLPAALFTSEFEIPTTDGSGNNRTQLLKADALLTEAGLVLKQGKRIDPATGEPFTIEFLLHSPVFERVVSPMRKHLKQLGIDATIRVVDEAQYQRRLEVFDYDMIVIWYNQSVFFPGNEQLIYWHSGQATQNGSSNYAGTQSPVIDHLLGKITSAATLEELTPAARALDRVLLWEHYIVPQWHSGGYRVAYWDKFGRPKVTPLYSLGFQTWWLTRATESSSKSH